MRWHHWRRWGTLVLCLLCGTAAADTALPISVALKLDPACARCSKADTALPISAALKAALMKNPKVQQFRTEDASARLQWLVARETRQPKITLSANGEQTRQKPRTGKDGPWAGGAQAALAWSLPLGSQLEASLDHPWGGSAAGDAMVQQLQWTLPLWRGSGGAYGAYAMEVGRWNHHLRLWEEEALFNALMSEAANAYLEAYAAEEQLDLSELALQRAREAAQTAATLWQAGRAAALDVRQAEADAARARLALEQSEHAARLARLRLCETMGLPELDDACSGALSLPNEQLDAEWSALPHSGDRSLESRVEWRVGEASWQLARLARDRATSDAKAQLDLVFGYKRSEGNGLPPDRQWSAGFRWTLPLDSNASQLPVVQAQASLDRAGLARQELERQITQERRNAQAEWLFALRQWELAKDAQRLSEQGWQAERARYEAGRSAASQVTQALDTWRSARFSELQAEIAKVKARLELHRSAGSLPDLRERWLGMPDKPAEKGAP